MKPKLSLLRPDKRIAWKNYTEARADELIVSMTPGSTLADVIKAKMKADRLHGVFMAAKGVARA